MINKFLVLTSLLLINFTISAQVKIGNTGAPVSSAILELSSADRGLLLSHVDLYGLTAAVNGGTPSLTVYGLNGGGAGQEGMVVYNVNSTAPFTVGTYIWQNGTWSKIGSGGDPWFLEGNANVGGSSFIGTTNTSPLVFKVNNIRVGYIEGNIGNIAIGHQALISQPGNASAYSTAIGRQALFSNTNGIGNVAVGAQTLYSNTLGNYNTAMGYNALNNNKLGNRNTAIGGSALERNSSGINNVASGFQALSSDTSGSNNVATGARALYGNVIGSFNVAVGDSSLHSIRAGSGATAIGAGAMKYANSTDQPYTEQNVAVGFEALRGSTTASQNTGNDNTAIGYRALLSNSSGNSNIAVGSLSLAFNTEGNNNVATGYSALILNQTGENNIAIGSNALLNNVAGNNAVAIGVNAMMNANNQASPYTNTSVAIGYEALKGNPGHVSNSNTAIGYQTLTNVTTGSYNVGTGNSALINNTIGSRNTANGSFALAQNLIGNNNTAMGDSALYASSTTHSNTAYGARSLAKNTGYSNTAGGFQSLYSNMGGNENVAFGNLALFSNSSGSGNIAIGNRALYANTTGFNNTAIGDSANVASSGLINATAIGANAYVSANNALVLGSINGVNGATSSTNVGIGTTAPTDKLHIMDGHIRSEQATAPAIASDSNGIFPGGSVSFVASSGPTDIKGKFFIQNGMSSDISFETRVNINFTTAMTNTNYVVIITPANDAARACRWSVDNISINQFRVNITTANNGTDPDDVANGFGPALGNPTFNYFVIN